MSMQEPAADGAQSKDMTRRMFVKGSMVAVTAGVGLATAGTAAAALNFDSDFVPDPRIEGEAVIETHDRARMNDDLAFFNDDGEVESLSDYGGVVAPREDEDTPHNPVWFEPATIDADDFSAFPRDETYTDADDEEADVSALDATHWGGGGTVTDGSADVENSLRIEGADDGESTFTEFEPVTSGVRRELQFIMTAETLSSDVEIGVEDSSGNRASVSAGSSLDDSQDDVFATDIPSGGVVVQKEIGSLNDSIGDIDTVFVDCGADSAVTLTALNIEKQSKWDFGDREVTETDDDGNEEVVTETNQQPAGKVELTGIGTLGDTFSDATINGLHVDFEQQASELPSDRRGSMFEEDGQFPAYDTRATYVYNFNLPAGYDVSYTLDGLVDTQSTFAERYRAVGYNLDAPEPQYSPEDAVADDEDDGDFTDVTQDFSSVDSDVTLTTDVSPGSDIGVKYEMLLTSTEESEAQAGGAVGGGFGGMGGGIGSKIWSVPGMLISGLGLAGLYRWFTGGGA